MKGSHAARYLGRLLLCIPGGQLRHHCAGYPGRGRVGLFSGSGLLYRCCPLHSDYLWDDPFSGHFAVGCSVQRCGLWRTDSGHSLQGARGIGGRYDNPRWLSDDITGKSGQGPGNGASFFVGRWSFRGCRSDSRGTASGQCRPDVRAFGIFRPGDIGFNGPSIPGLQIPNQGHHFGPLRTPFRHGGARPHYWVSSVCVWNDGIEGGNHLHPRCHRSLCCCGGVQPDLPR